MNRIYLSGPHFRRTQPREAHLWLELRSPLASYHAYVIRSEYRRLRRAGLSAFQSRKAVYKLLDTGRYLQKGENYR